MFFYSNEAGSWSFICKVLSTISPLESTQGLKREKKLHQPTVKIYKMRARVFGYEFCTPKGPLQKAFLSLKGSTMMLLQKAFLFVARSQAKPLHFVDPIFGLWTWFCSSKMGAPRIVAIKRLHRCTPAIWTRIYIVLYILFYKIFYIILYIYINIYVCTKKPVVSCCFNEFVTWIWWLFHRGLRQETAEKAKQLDHSDAGGGLHLKVCWKLLKIWKNVVSLID